MQSWPGIEDTKIKKTRILSSRTHVSVRETHIHNLRIKGKCKRTMVMKNQLIFLTRVKSVFRDKWGNIWAGLRKWASVRKRKRRRERMRERGREGETERMRERVAREREERQRHRERREGGETESEGETERVGWGERERRRERENEGEDKPRALKSMTCPRTRLI